MITVAANAVGNHGRRTSFQVRMLVMAKEDDSASAGEATSRSAEAEHRRRVTEAAAAVAERSAELNRRLARR